MTNPIGRPTKYKPEYCDEVIALGKTGKSVTQIASYLDVNKTSLYEWAKEHAEFSNALTRARQEAQTWWEDKGQMGIETPGFNASLWSKQVSCRFPEDYRETKDINLGGQVDNPVKLEADLNISAAEQYSRMTNGG